MPYMDFSYRTLTDLDIPYCRKVLEMATQDHLTDDYVFDMTTWVTRVSPEHKSGWCGTKACLAGTALLLDPEATLTFDHHGLLSTCEVNGQYVDAELHAVELLGMDREDAHELFTEYGNLTALETFRDLIALAEDVQASR